MMLEELILKAFKEGKVLNVAVSPDGEGLSIVKVSYNKDIFYAAGGRESCDIAVKPAIKVMVEELLKVW